MKIVGLDAENTQDEYRVALVLNGAPDPEAIRAVKINNVEIQPDGQTLYVSVRDITAASQPVGKETVDEIQQQYDKAIEEKNRRLRNEEDARGKMLQRIANETGLRVINR